MISAENFHFPNYKHKTVTSHVQNEAFLSYLVSDILAADMPDIADIVFLNQLLQMS